LSSRLARSIVSYSSTSKCISYLFFYRDPSTSAIYTLSLHDALPIYRKLYRPILVFWIELINRLSVFIQKHQVFYMIKTLKHRQRSEEHTSELQSRENLVCRLLLEKKTTIT